MKIDRIKIGRQIKLLRMNDNLSINEYSKKIDISVYVLKRIEEGRLLIKLKDLVKICNYYKINMTYFLSYKMLDNN